MEKEKGPKISNGQQDQKKTLNLDRRNKATL